MQESSVFEWLTGTDFAVFIRQSPHLVGLLSSLHLLGLTVIGGSGIVSLLKALGMLVPERPLAEVLRPAWKGIVLGFAISLASGVFLFAPRASSAVGDPAFQAKMLLVLVAIIFHFTLVRYAAKRAESSSTALLLTVMLGLVLWVGVAFAGFAFAVFN
jgi:hypothetical protein